MEFLLNYSKSWKMMLWKCCTEYASKFGKLSRGHRTRKCQFSFQLQRRAMPKNVQTAAQLHSFHTLIISVIVFSYVVIFHDHNKLWIILKKMGILDHLTCLLRNLCAGQEAIVRTAHWTIYWFQIQKRIYQGCILSACLFNLYAEYMMWNAGLDEAQAGIKMSGELSITSDM